MEGAIARLSEIQIKNFFLDTLKTQQQCDDSATRLLQVAQGRIRPTPGQGSASYTVEAHGSEYIVRFRASGYNLDMDLVSCIEKVYEPYVPSHEDHGLLGDLHIYKVNNIGGSILYLARENLHKKNLLPMMLRDYARVFASAWLKRTGIPSCLRPDPQSLLDGYLKDLGILCTGLPSRFREILTHLIQQLPRLFADDWPMVPNHMDLRDNNIHLDPATGRLMGICDWGETVFSPFGMSLWGLETVLGVEKVTGWEYYTDQEHLRAIFWDAFREFLDRTPDGRIEVARLVGIFLANGWQSYDGEGKVPLKEGHRCMKFLNEAILGPQLRHPAHRDMS